jgi:hypothetical protein
LIQKKEIFLRLGSSYMESIIGAPFYVSPFLFYYGFRP